jgi:protein-tyrosine phosphatase
MKTGDQARAENFLAAARRWSAALGNPGADGKIAKRETLRMDLTWVTERIAVGGGIWNAPTMAEVAAAGVTHILDMQVEFDDTELATPHGITVMWDPIDDDFLPKPPEVFQQGVDFALKALEENGSKLFVHCAAGVHRGPMMTLAILCSMNYRMGEAMRLIENKRPGADFADVYVESVKRFLVEQAKAAK